ncbi:tellurite resistance TerB family protein [Thauera aromatica]|uniref:tellurite resistance TerB family protein n=1 Tax=Thauera aromatica TaxID=59405 RepID=UPI001FFDBFB4|nr:TerB family tellurite resistance protein [Thauera aromatica]MCK2097724.1 TerB family tellurite resistance protein [Thauera aromatica]
MFGKLFGKKVGAAKAELKRVENKDLMQAVVGAMVLIAYADGECERSELEKIERLVAANDSLAHFGNEINTTMGRYIEFMEAGPRMGEMKIMREIADVKNDPKEAEEVFVLAITVAEADGEIEPAEIKVLAKIGRELGLRLQDFGIEA